MALPQVRAARSAQDMWQELGLEEMSEYEEDPETVWDVDSAGSDSHSSDSHSSASEQAYMSGDGNSDSDCELCEGLLKRRVLC